MTHFNSELEKLAQLETEIKSSQIQIVLHNAVQSAFGNIFVGLVFALFYTHYTNQSVNIWLYTWLAAMIGVSVTRWLHSEHLQSKFSDLKSEHDVDIETQTAFQTQHKAHQYLIDSSSKHYLLILLTAGLWGFASVAFFSEHPIGQTVLMVSIAGIAAGSLSSLSSIKELLFTFIALILIPLEFQLFFSHGEQSLAFAIMLLLFMAFIIKTGLQQHQLILETLTTNFENNQLITELTIAKNVAEEAVTVKSNFLATISHELRTPLNAILGFTNILKQKETDPQKLYFHEVVDESGHHLLSIINDILDLSRIENHQIQTQQQTCDIAEVIKSVLDKHRKQYEQKSIEVLVHKNTSIPSNLELDVAHWKQILNNLLSNALKFSHQNTKVRIELEYIPSTQMLVTHVVDQGIGISNDQQKKIFDAFTQADSSSTRQYGGLGLGLTICHHLTRLLGGHFSLQSQIGQGSTFTFDVQANATSDAPEPEKKTLPNSKISGHVLIVEDNLTNQLLMKSLIGKLGLTFDIANDGIEAVEYFEDNHYDAILMDENMPRLSGTGATEQIRQIEAQKFLKRTPVIAVTANASDLDRERFFKADMDDFIAKPINIPKLVESLRGFLTPSEELTNSKS